ncbi:MAG TPA: hypothetical protein VMR50_16915 [Myxococcota bacterium]|nr:hypothetical protein [Myxococcota bacterium]
MSSRGVALAVVSLALGFGTVARAGNLKVVQSGTTVKATGDAAGVSVGVTSVSEGDSDPTTGVVRFVPLDGSTVNGGTADVQFNGVKNVSIKLGKGPNSVGGEEIDVLGNFAVKGGASADELTFGGGFVGGILTLDGGDGADTVECQDIEIGRDAVLKSSGSGLKTFTFGCNAAGNLKASFSGSGHNQLNVTDDASAEFFTLKANGAFDEINVGAASIGQNAKLSHGNGAGTVIFTGTLIGEALSVGSGSGADTIRLNGAHVGAAAKINAGNGANILIAGPDQTLIGESFQLTAGAGADTFNLQNVTVGEDCTIKIGNGANHGTITGFTIGEDFTVTAGTGSNNVSVTGNTVGGVTKIGSNVGP